MKPAIKVSVELIQHPEPKKLIDVWANVVLKELEKGGDAA